MTTTTVQCACGATFEREAKRGRPQLWCEDCRAIPFAARVKGHPQVVPTVTATEATPAIAEADKPHSEYRDQIEAGVADVYAEHKATFAARVAAGEDRFAVADEVQAETSRKLREVYGWFDKRFHEVKPFVHPSVRTEVEVEA